MLRDNKCQSASIYRALLLLLLLLLSVYCLLLLLWASGSPCCLCESRGESFEFVSSPEAGFVGLGKIKITAAAAAIIRVGVKIGIIYLICIIRQ